MDLDLLLLILVGGIPVLSSYLHLYNRIYEEDSRISVDALLQPFVKDGNNSWKYLWYFTSLLTVASYIYIFIEFAINDVLEEDWQRSVLVVSYTLFLSNACQYTHVTMTDLAMNSKSYYLQYNLYAVAVASVGFLIVAIALGNAWLIAATIIIVLHHFVMDAVLWYNGFLEYEGL